MAGLHSRRAQQGFTLIELLVVIGIFGLVIGIAAQLFSITLTQSTLQTKTAESEIEGIIGLELLRLDIEHAGAGLPWSFPTRDASDVSISLAYNEAADNVKYVSTLDLQAKDFNDAPKGEPRPILTGRHKSIGKTGLNGSDVLVLKGSTLARSDTAQRWSYVTSDAPLVPKAWGSEDLKNGEKVIVMKPAIGEASPRQLVMVGANTFYTTYSATAFPAGFAPTGPGEHFVIYGIDPATNPRMPFNRADYYLSAANVPKFCAPNTGVLEKAVLNQGDGKLSNPLPLLDCVADVKVQVRVDLGGGSLHVTDDFTDTGGNALSVSNIRKIREVTVFVLAHEGQKDRSYMYPNGTVAYGGYSFDLSSKVGGDWQNYRWKVYRITVKPKNLG